MRSKVASKIYSETPESIKKKVKEIAMKTLQTPEKSFLMTRRQLRKATLANKYIAVRFPDGDLLGINCRVADILVFRRGVEVNDTPTKFVGFKPISFQEYITIKGPYFL